MQTQTDTKTDEPIKFFTQPAVLENIGSTRLNRFLHRFAGELNATGMVLPQPGAENGHYFFAVAKLFADARLPEQLRHDLVTLEAAASPPNQDRLDAIIAERISGSILNRYCPFDRALELWFHAPDELRQFEPSIPTGLRAEAQGRTAGELGESGPTLGNGATETANFEKVEPPSPQNSVPAPQAEVGNCQSTVAAQSQIQILPHGAHGGTKIDSPSSLLQAISPWPDPVDGRLLLDDLAEVLRRYVVLPLWAAEALALWIVHTFAFHLRDVSAYIGVESPEKRCGKTTLLTLVSQLVNRPVVASNISPPAFFRVIEELQPTLLIDEADTFLQGNDELRGILNSGNNRKTSFVVRVAPQSPSSPASKKQKTDTSAQLISQLAKYSCWCPKMIAAIGRLPDTLADRCIVIRMQRKTSSEQCERLRSLEAEPLRRRCARFVLDHASTIAAAQPKIPALNDRAADIWEPLLAIADLAGGHWPDLARQAAVALTSRAQEHNPIGSLLLDIFVLFSLHGGERVFTRTLLAGLSSRTDRPWADMRKGKELTDSWLSQQLRPYGIRPRNIWINGEQAKGYVLEECLETFRRYIPRSELDALIADSKPGPNAKNDAKGEPPPATAVAA